MIVFTTSLLAFVPMKDGEIFLRPNALIDLYSTFYTFRFLLMILFTIFATSVVISILKSYKINYLFIFELDPHYKMTPIQLFRVSIN